MKMKTSLTVMGSEKIVEAVRIDFGSESRLADYFYVVYLHEFN